MLENKFKTYVGDGIYMELISGDTETDCTIQLTTEDGIEVQNQIIIEGREWRTMLESREHLLERAKEEGK